MDTAIKHTENMKKIHSSTGIERDGQNMKTLTKLMKFVLKFNYIKTHEKKGMPNSYQTELPLIQK